MDEDGHSSSTGLLAGHGQCHSYGMTTDLHTAQTQLNPRKLLLSKWTAVAPLAREKHFLVVRLIEPAQSGSPVKQIELQAVLTRRSQIMAWRELTDSTRWLQGWQ